jgi:tetratricopeptide (TPR) repeat protein
MLTAKGIMYGCCLLVLAGNAAAGETQQYKELYRKGVEANKKGDLKESISWYSKAIAEKPDSADLYFVRGRAYGQDQQMDKAISDLSKAVALRPGYGEAYNHRGVMYIVKGDKEKAQADFRKGCSQGLKDACANLEKTRSEK